MPSVPPAVILKVMQALDNEMKIRDQTRELESAKPDLGAEDYATATAPVREAQFDNSELLRSAALDLIDIPNGDKIFEKQLQLLRLVAGIMDEAGGLLSIPNTGKPTIGAETDAIERLLEATRNNPNGGGGGGAGSPGGGATALSSSSVALLGLGAPSEPAENPEARAAGQATGRAGREFPDEFRNGLDAYFNALESNAKR